MTILAVIPACNEADHIATVVAAVSRHLPVLVVDDGSQDDTAARAEAAGAAIERQTPNLGKGAALRTGFRRALETGYSAVLMLDADGQHDPAEIPAFLDAYQARGADLIIGARDFSQMPPLRRLSNTFGRLSFSWVMGRPIRDNQSGYRLVSRRLLEQVVNSLERGFEFEVEMIAICLKHQFTLDWVPIRTIYADERSHIRPGKHVVNFFRILWKTWRMMRA